jgi:hypothetical protein
MGDVQNPDGEAQRLAYETCPSRKDERMPDELSPTLPTVAEQIDGGVVPAESEGRARLGAALLDRPIAEIRTENVASFRAVSNHDELGNRLGLLRDLPGQWFGRGFNLIARPDFAGQNELFLELNLTQENLDFHSIGSPIPNRGNEQPDINLFGLHYLDQIRDATNGGALHIEPGIWLNIPATTDPPFPPTVARLASIPHGDVINALGQASVIEGPPVIEPANTVPFAIGGPPPQFGTPNPFPEFDLDTASPYRTSPLSAEVTQAVVTDPNAVLREALIGQTVLETIVLEVSTAPNGSVGNIPFIVNNAEAVSVSATFWIETVTDASNTTFMQLQYTQTVLLNFRHKSWPHVSVATLIKAF